MNHQNVRINVIVNIIRTIALTVLSFITFPYVCRVLGDQTLGLYSWCNTFVYYFLILAKIGIPNLAVRECVKVRNDKEKLSNVAQTFFLIQSVTTIISFAFMCSLIFTIPALRSSSSIILLLSLNFVSGAFSFEWIYIALEKQLYMSIRSLIVLALSAILIISLVTSKDDIYIYCLCTAGVTIITTICNVFYVTKYISFKKTMPWNFKKFLKPLSVLFLLSLFLALYNQTDQFILGFIDQSKAEVGAYSVGIKGIEIIIGIIAALSTVFIPRSAYYYELEDKSYFNRTNKYSINICLFIVLPAIVTMSVLSEPICALISGNLDLSLISTSGNYSSAPFVLIALCSMMITYSLGDIIYGQILLPMKKEKYYLYAISIGTIVNIGLSFLFGLVFFKNQPALGVAIATSLTDLLVLLFLLFISWKYTKSAIFNKNSLKLLIANLIILVFTLIIRLVTPISNIFINNGVNKEASLILELVIMVIVDAIIYIGSLALLKEDLVSSLFRKKQEIK